jgi:hypothetical protein
MGAVAVSYLGAGLALRASVIPASAPGKTNTQ